VSLRKLYNDRAGLSSPIPHYIDRFNLGGYLRRLGEAAEQWTPCAPWDAGADAAYKIGHHSKGTALMRELAFENSVQSVRLLR
jgi:hypothetical protein